MDRGCPIPPLAPMTATFLWATELVENCLEAVDTGLANLENMMSTLIKR